MGQHKGTGGFVIIPVAMAVAIIGVLAFYSANQSAIHVNIAGRELETTRAEYVAQAGLQHALQHHAQQGCGPYTDLNKFAFGDDEYDTQLTHDLGVTTSYSLPVDQDAWIGSFQPADNHGNDPSLHLSQSGGDNEIALLRYDLSTVPTMSPILSARAWFYVQTEHPEGPVEIHPLDADWTEADATWDTLAAALDPAILATIPSQPTAGVWISVNLTAWVQAWVNGEPNHGLALVADSEGVDAVYQARDAANPPYLEVIVGGAPSSPARLRSTSKTPGGRAATVIRDVALRQNPPGFQQYQPGDSDGKDSFFLQGDPNFGGADYLRLSTRFNGVDEDSRLVLQFNLGSIPSGAKIVSAQLQLYQASAPNGTSGLADVHRITSSWAETDVTWVDREGFFNWSSAGGDYDPTAVAQTQLEPATGWYSWDITRLVDGWVNGAYPNHGLLLRSAEANLEYRDFHSSEQGNAALRPKLIITYQCDCGSACVVPQGSGRIALIGGWPLYSIDPAEVDQEKQAVFESWGYEVDQYDDNYIYLLDPNNYDAVFVSETVGSGTVGTQLTGFTIGVVNAEGELNDELGIAGGAALPVGDRITVADNGHYITQPFRPGDLSIYAGPMQGLAAAVGEAPGAQLLADWGSAASLIAIDAGGELYGGGNAAGRRVLVPIGPSIDWSQINSNGRLILQRALAWAADPGPCPTETVRDEFSVSAFDGNNGSQNWLGPWIEIGESDGAKVGQVLTVSTDGSIRLGITNGNGQPYAAKGAYRAADLSSAASATLSFTYKRVSVDADDFLAVQVSTDGGASWTDIGSITGPVSLDSSFTPVSFDLSAHLSANTLLRFVSSFTSTDYYDTIYLDDIEIAYGACAPPVGPFAHWKLDETSGITAVDSEGGHHGTLTNGPTWDSGTIDGALAFDGVDDYVDLTSDAELNDVFVGGATVTAWVYLDGWGENAYGRILDKSSAVSDNRDGWMIGTDGGNQSIAFAQGFSGERGFWRPPNNTVNLNEWIHYAIVYDASSDANDPLIYLNGVAQTSLVEITPSGTIRSDAGIALRMGNHAQDTSRTLDGRLDDVRIYDRMLTTEEIAELAALDNHVLYVVRDPNTLSSEEATRQTLMEGWGFVVNLIDDDDAQANFDSATAANNAVYVSQEAVAVSLGTKLVNTTIGVVNESKDLIDEFGFATGLSMGGGTPPLKVDFSHYITSVFSANPVAPYAANEWYQIVNEPVASGVDAVGAWVDAPWAGKPALMALDQGAALIAGGTAAGRRVQIPWGSGQGATPVANASLSDDARTIIKRSIEWAAGAGDGSGGGTPPPETFVCDGTYGDNFDAVSFAGSNGDIDWSESPWTEVGESDLANAGDVRVLNDISNYQLRLRDNDSGGEGVERSVDLSGATTATLIFDYRRQGLDSADDYVKIEVAAEGSDYTEIGRIDGELVGSDGNYQTFTQSLNDHLSADTRIRLLTSPSMGHLDVVWFDNIQVNCGSL